LKKINSKLMKTFFCNLLNNIFLILFLFTSQTFLSQNVRTNLTLPAGQIPYFTQIGGGGLADLANAPLFCTPNPNPTAIGIFTSTPQQPLHVSGKVRFDLSTGSGSVGRMYLNRPALLSQENLLLYTTAGTSSFDWATGCPLGNSNWILANAGGTVMTSLASNGNVGIGSTMTSPPSKLSVGGDVMVLAPGGSSFQITGNATGDIASYTSISAHFGGSTNSGDNFSIYQGIIGSGKQRLNINKLGSAFFRTNDGTSTNMAFQLVNDISANQYGGNPLLQILNNASTTIRDYYGTSTNLLTLQRLNGSILKFYANTNGDITSDHAMQHHFATNTQFSVWEGITTTTSDALRFQVNPNGAILMKCSLNVASTSSPLVIENDWITCSSTPYCKNVFEVRPSGQTYIGTQRNTNHTSAMLHVNGDVVVGTTSSANIYVTQQNWSDFVFDKNYKLMSLEEVETFYSKNHHLPGVPTEADIKENGNNLGQTDAVLLQKVEELTLYVVELKKEIEILKKKQQ
jgi:hypothetical protein